MGDAHAELRAQFLAVLRPHMRKVPDPELAVYMMSVAAHAIIHTATDERPDLLDTPELVDELVTMLENFIAR